MKTKEINTIVKWSIDHDHSEIEFKVRHLLIAHVKGEFKVFDASIYTNNKDFSTAEIDLWIDVSSVTTGNEKRDEHLISSDFFDLRNHKQITFKSSTIGEPDADGISELWGELTMIGVTKNVKLNIQFGGIVNDPWGNEKAGFTITGMINRNDWGLNWNATMENGGFMISNEVIISCEVELNNVNQKDLIMELEPTIDIISSK
ncbi:MAG: YceI family protein [Bacteroidota bacterium]